LYTIKYGDDLGEIAKKYDVTIDAIVKLNPLVIDDPDTILAGDETLNLMLTPQ
jgi:LysM repeat protein